MADLHYLRYEQALGHWGVVYVSDQGFRAGREAQCGYEASRSRTNREPRADVESGASREVAVAIGDGHTCGLVSAFLSPAGLPAWPLGRPLLLRPRGLGLCVRGDISECKSEGANLLKTPEKEGNIYPNSS